MLGHSCNTAVAGDHRAKWNEASADGEELCEILKSDLMAFVGKWYPEAGGGRGRLGKGELV